MRPGRQIHGTVEHDAIARREHHDPLCGRFMEEHLRIAEVDQAGIGKDRIGRVWSERTGLVVADRDTLDLSLTMVSKHRKDTVDGRGATETADSFAIHDRTAGERHPQHRVRRQRCRQISPTHKISADGMAPMDGAPRELVRIMLIEKMILSVQMDEPVRIVHPVGWRSEVIHRARIEFHWRRIGHWDGLGRLAGRAAPRRNDKNI